MGALHEVRQEAELFVEHRLAEVALEGPLVAMAAAVEYIGAVVREEYIARLAAVEARLFHQTLDDEVGVTALEIAAVSHRALLVSPQEGATVAPEAVQCVIQGLGAGRGTVTCVGAVGAVVFTLAQTQVFLRSR